MNTVEAIKHLFLNAGTGWVLWLLGALSIVSIAVSLERWRTFRRMDGDVESLARALAERLGGGSREETIQWLLGSPAVGAQVAAAGLAVADRGVKAVEKAMASRTVLARESLERRLAYLGTLGNNAPFIGLFGTVIGVIEAFEELGHGTAGHAGAGAAGHVASGAVMSAIAEALVATAVGIAVALPAVAAYNYLQRRVEQLLAGAEALSNLVLAYLCAEED
jgi:biopolymer transport protein ExbB